MEIAICFKTVRYEMYHMEKFLAEIFRQKCFIHFLENRKLFSFFGILEDWHQMLQGEFRLKNLASLPCEVCLACEVK